MATLNQRNSRIRKERNNSIGRGLLRHELLEFAEMKENEGEKDEVTIRTLAKYNEGYNIDELKRRYLINVYELKEFRIPLNNINEVEIKVPYAKKLPKTIIFNSKEYEVSYNSGDKKVDKIGVWPPREPVPKQVIVKPIEQKVEDVKPDKPGRPEGKRPKKRNLEMRANDTENIIDKKVKAPYHNHQGYFGSFNPGYA